VIDLLFRQLYLFFIVELGSRRVVHFGVTRHPTDAWVAHQLREATPYGQAPRFLLHDNDRKYGPEFTHIARATGIKVLRTPFRAPRTNAICERFLKSVRNECLDQLLIWSGPQLYRVVREYVQYFNRARPHQGIGQKIPEGKSTVGEAESRGKIIAFPMLNGLHHDYRRIA
jgi:putative transposase